MIRILAFTPSRFDSTSFYRCWGVFHNLRRIMHHQIEVVAYERGNFTWAELTGFDILYLHRPAHKVLTEMAAYCAKINVKIWVDYDDNLFQLPIENRAFDNYTDEVRKDMYQALQLAHVVTVSTGRLADFFREIGIKSPIYVVPNALNNDIFTINSTCNANSSVIAWRGSDTHSWDLSIFTPALLTAIEANPADVWHFFGYMPPALHYFIKSKNVRYSKAVDPIIFHENLKATGPRLMHVPLADNPLNRSKSNIAWIEATCAGAVTIAPDWPEWQKPGVINYKDATHFAEIMKNLPTPVQLIDLWKQSRDYINENLLLSHVNEQRRNIIDELMTPGAAKKENPTKKYSDRVKDRLLQDQITKESAPTENLTLNTKN